MLKHGQVKPGGVIHHILFFRSPIESPSNARLGRGLLLGKEVVCIGKDLGSWAFPLAEARLRVANAFREANAWDSRVPSLANLFVK